MPSINDKIVLNFKDVREKLAGLPKRLKNSAIRKGVYAGAKVIRDEARARVPVDTGALRSTIVAQTNKTKGGEISASVGIRRKKFSRGARAGRSPRRYAHLVEFGTVRAGAQPFMRPAMDTSMGRVVEVIAATIRAQLDKETAKRSGPAKTEAAVEVAANVAATAEDALAQALEMAAQTDGEVIVRMADGSRSVLVREHKRGTGTTVKSHLRRLR